jgi:hypothetical protein
MKMDSHLQQSLLRSVTPRSAPKGCPAMFDQLLREEPCLKQPFFSEIEETVSLETGLQKSF